MKKVINTSLIILIIIAVVILGVIGFNYYKSNQNDQELNQVVQQIENEFENKTSEEEKIKIEWIYDIHIL